MLLEKLVIPIGFDTGMLIAGIDAITGLITGAVERTREWGDSLDSLGDVTGMSEDRLASWSYVANKAGVETSTLASATVILSKGLFDSAGELSSTGKALQDFGIDILDANGNIRDQGDLMADIAKKYAEFGTQTQRVDFLTNVFGRSGSQLIGMFDVLANEGGIDKVKEKVESLGLVLDAGRYGQFEDNLREVDLTITGLANAFTGPLLPAAESLLKTFTSWLQSPWVAEGIANIAENLGAFASDIAKGIETGDWDAFFADIKEFTGFDLAAINSNFAEFEAASQAETAAIKQHWNELLSAISERLNIVFGTEGINLVIDWKQIGITALQAVDIILYGLTKTWEFFNTVLQRTADLLSVISGRSSIPAPSGYTPYPGYGQAIAKPSGGFTAPRRASGGPAGGLTWVGERGPELVSLPGGSQVNNTQASAAMGIDYYKLASILAVEFAKVRD